MERFGQIALVFRNSLDDRVTRSTGQAIEKAIDLSRHNGTPFLLDQVICPTPGRSAPFYDDSSCGMTAIKRTTWGDATLWIVAIGTFSRPRPRAAREWSRGATADTPRFPLRLRPCPCPACPVAVRPRTCWPPSIGQPCDGRSESLSTSAFARTFACLRAERVSPPAADWRIHCRLSETDSRSEMNPYVIPSSFSNLALHLRIGEPPPATRGAAARLSPSSP